LPDDSGTNRFFFTYFFTDQSMAIGLGAVFPASLRPERDIPAVVPAYLCTRPHHYLRLEFGVSFF
jgi:hypothetical protein